MTIPWNELAIWWNEVYQGWNEVVWNEVVMERSDRNSFQYTHFSFCHAPEVKKKDLSKAKQTFEDNIKNFRLDLRVPGYPDNLVNKVLAEVNFTDRKSALQQKPQKCKTN